MSDIVADAKAWLESYMPAHIHSENCHRWHVGCLIVRLVAEVERHRMTPEEREAAACAAGLCIGGVVGGYLDRTAQKEGGNG